MTFRIHFICSFILLVFIVLPQSAGAQKKRTANSHAYRIARNIQDPAPDFLKPANLPSGSIGRKNLVADKPFSRIDALKKLFPGNYYHLTQPAYTDELHLIAWRCTGCPQKTFDGWIENDAVKFPGREINITEPHDSLLFTDDKGIRHIIFSFASHDVTTPEDMHNGRLTSAAMGLAWFTEHNNQWILRNFTPCIGLYGAFQWLPAIRLIKFGKNNYGCYLLNSNGGPGQVYYTDLVMFGIANNEWRIVLKDKNVERTNTPSSQWKMVFNTAERESAENWMSFNINIDGIYRKYTPDTTYDWTDHPIEMPEAMQETDSLHFRVVRRFQYMDGQYRKTSGKITAATE